MKVLILADAPGWAVDRNTDQMIGGIPADFTKRYYTKISSEDLVELANNHDLVHYQNWDLQYHLDVLDKINTPFLLSIRSHRFPSYVKDVAKNVTQVHVLNRQLQKEFAGSVYIPNGVANIFLKEKKDFIVGFSGKTDEYKGYNLIKKACEELGVRFFPAAGNIPIEEMPQYYKSINLLVSASLAEGHCNPILECMAMDVPIITTDVGVAHELNVVKIDRNVESIKNGILKFCTHIQVENDFSWDSVNEKFYKLYKDIINCNKIY